MIIVDCEQGSAEWLKMRRGIPTSSEFNKILTMQRKRSAQRDQLLYLLAAERITGETRDQFFGYDMARGQEMEPEAVGFYEFENEVEVKRVGFCYRDEMRLYGSSTDGLVGSDGVLEIKNGKQEIHLERMMTGWKGKSKQAQLSTFWHQCQGELFVTGREWCDLVSYCRGMQLYVKRIYPDLAYFKCLEEELLLLNEDLTDVVKKYRSTL